ncbi:putative methyltransferase C9orf114 [Cylas formicarius]|uniref:putative methyltransferase C9orf114 n=1 Tax=Cylas formicarius TaxID=197179 RepID=UPI00295866B1|nr:putative methyltransferase C9orf114 [Cylas formicarius]
MGPFANANTKKKWSEINKQKKERNKKWKEEKLMKKAEKRKRKLDEASEGPKEKKVKKPKELSTLSIAVPGSILDNAQSAELRTYLAGQIARAACIFQVDEVIVYDDYSDEASAKKSKFNDETGLEKVARQSCVKLGRILQYLECPQYLRKSFFPIHNDLKFCGLLNPLNAPHHLSTKDDFVFREGVVLNTPVKEGKGSLVNVGLLRQVRVDKLLLPGVRCTVKLEPSTSKKLKGVVVSPSAPRNETGIYWGYRVRIANSLSKVFSQCPYEGGYDISIGTSDKGTSVDTFECTKYKHLLIMFGGLQGLEGALESDETLNTDDPSLLFDHYLNTLPQQGSKTIRTEEAILISLSVLRPKLNPETKCPEFDEADMEYRESSLAKGDNTKVQQEAEEHSDDLSKFD